MSGIPIGEAAFEGFRVIGRRPLAVLVWGLALFVIAVLPLMAVFSMLASAIGDLIRETTPGGEPSMESIIAIQVQMMAVNPLLMISSLLSRVLLTCAIFRVVLEPQDSRFFYLRLGKAELFVGLVYLCLMFLIGLLALAGIGIGAGLAIAGWAASEALGIGLAIVLALALLAVVIWLGLRLSMAMPMTFAERRFRFFESWEMTRGHVLSLFLIGLLTVVIVWLLEMVMIGVVLAAVIPLVMSRPFDEAAITAFFSRPVEEWTADLAPWVLIGGLVFSLFGAVLYTVITAPWAAAYRYLAPKAAAEAQSPA